MKKHLLIILILLISLIAIPGVFAKTGNIKLLAVYTGKDMGGSVADLKLELKPGTGRVFIETIPLAQIDTQMSTRFAKETACKFSSKDCNKYDFFYTIKSEASIIGGPSAGAAVSTLTVALLEGLTVDKSLAITGTINSGELIGPIGSVKQKIDAAKKSGLKTVIIPSVQHKVTEKNKTIDLVEYGKSNNVLVLPASTLSEAVEKATGIKFEEKTNQIIEDINYKKTMKTVATQLCSRSQNLANQVDTFKLKDFKVIDSDFIKQRKKAEDLIERSKNATIDGKDYSSASYCFGANIITNTLLFKLQNLSPTQTKIVEKQLDIKINRIDTQLQSTSKKSITDLQTYMIVKERLLEAKKALEGNNTYSDLAYVSERIASAESWSIFFDQTGTKYNLDKKELKASCELKLKEVDERVMYLNYFFNNVLIEITKNLQDAHTYYKNEEYELCLFKASKTEAEANVVVGLLGVEQSNIDAFLKMKIVASKKEIAKQIDNEIFPILAYSYYEYADRLQNESIFSSILYAEYALSLSNIDIYLSKERKAPVKITKKINWNRLTSIKYWYLVIFVWGLILGYLYRYAIKRERKLRASSYPTTVFRSRTKKSKLKFKK